MATTHFSGPVDSVAGFQVNGTSVVSSAGTVTSQSSIVVGSTTISEAEIGVLDAVTPGTAAASKALVLNSSSAITTGLTTLTATNVNPTTLTVSGHSLLSVAAKTAGTTQTQAGATAITSTITIGTTGNADDGYLLPAMLAGQVLIIHNASANAGKVYANGTETLNGTAGNAGSTALSASKTMLVFASANGVSLSAVMM